VPFLVYGQLLVPLGETDIGSVRYIRGPERGPLCRACLDVKLLDLTVEAEVAAQEGNGR
jgi:hypothetical protein